MRGDGPDLPDMPETQETSTVGGFVWIALFGCVMAMSAIANVVLVALIAARRGKRGPVYLLHCLMFAVNVVDYCLLSFEFSMGVDHVFPYSEAACKAYQAAAKGNSIFQSWLVVALVCYAAWKYGRTGRGENVAQATPRTEDNLLLSCILLVLLAAVIVVSVPTAYFATLVEGSESSFCEIDTSDAMPGHSLSSQLKAISGYYLIFSSALPFWIPLMVALRPMKRLAAVQGEHVEVRVTTSTVLSYFVFFLPHGVIVLIRHSVDAFGGPMSPYNLWMVKIGQSLLWLVAYFWHFARPALVISLDPDLRPRSIFKNRSPSRVPVTRAAPAGKSINNVIVSVRDGQKQGCGRVGADEGVGLLSP